MRRLREAAVEGLVLGVKYGVALVVIGALVLLAVGDYQVVRARAENGQRAFQFLAEQSQKVVPAP